MVRHHPRSPLERLLLGRRQLPWWSYLTLALLCWLLLHQLAGELLLPSANLSVTEPQGTLLHSFALVAQALLPLALVCAAIANLYNRLSQRRRVLRLEREPVAERLLEQLRWHEVCLLITAALEDEGYRVASRRRAAFEQQLQRDGEPWLLIGNYWRDSELSLTILQAVAARIQQQALAGALVVCAAQPSSAISRFAEQQRIRLLDRRQLQQWLVQRLQLEPVTGT